MRYSIYKNEILKDPRSKKLNFEPDGRKHYVYRVTDYTRSEKEHYYGSRTSNKGNVLEDFWSYRTSSKYNTLNENKKENYKIKIVRVFDNPGDKILFEAFLHKFFNVKLHNSFWNESNQTPFGFDTTGLKFENDHKKRKTYEEIHGEIVGSKLRKNRIGKNNPNSKSIQLFNDNNNLVFECSTIKEFYMYCKNNNLPSRMYDKNKKESLQIFKPVKNTSKKFLKFEGWYVIKN